MKTVSLIYLSSVSLIVFYFFIREDVFSEKIVGGSIFSVDQKPG